MNCTSSTNAIRALPESAAQTSNQPRPTVKSARGAPMLPSFPMIMTPQGMIPALMMNPGMAMHNPCARLSAAASSNPVATQINSTQQQYMALQQRAVQPVQTNGMQFYIPQMQMTNGNATHATPAYQMQMGNNSATQATPSFQMQPQQWGMVPTKMPGGQLMYMMVPMSQMRPAVSGANANSGAKTTQQQPMGFQFMQAMPSMVHQTAPLAQASTSLTRASIPTEPVPKTPSVPPLQAVQTSDPHALPPHSHSIVTTAQAAVPEQESPSTGTADTTEPYADMLRVFLGQDEEFNAWGSHDGVDDLFSEFDSGHEELKFDTDLNISLSSSWSELDVDEPLSLDQSTDSIRTVDTMHAEDDSLSGVSGRCASDNVNRYSSKSFDAMLKPTKGGITKTQSTRSVVPNVHRVEEELDLLWTES